MHWINKCELTWHCLAPALVGLGVRCRSCSRGRRSCMALCCWEPGNIRRPGWARWGPWRTRGRWSTSSACRRAQCPARQNGAPGRGPPGARNTAPDVQPPRVLRGAAGGPPEGESAQQTGARTPEAGGATGASTSGGAHPSWGRLRQESLRNQRPGEIGAWGWSSKVGGEVRGAEAGGWGAALLQLAATGVWRGNAPTRTLAQHQG